MIPPQRALPFGAAILPTILMISLCHLSLAHDSSQVLVVALVIVGAGRLPFPLSWVTAMQIAAVIGWAVVSFVALPADLAFSLMGALAVVALLSSPYMQRRLSSMVGGTFADHDMQSDDEPFGAGGVSTLAGALADCAAEHFPSDKLTGLPGRNAFLAKLRDAVEQARGSSRVSYIAVMVLDLDGFKSINDSLSYEVGDQVLANAASRLRRCLRRRSDDFPARLGADEFAVLLQRLQKPDDALRIAKRIQAWPWHFGQCRLRQEL
jgi:predicted signal transduction protein with EAL and GGDEF domain